MRKKQEHISLNDQAYVLLKWQILNQEIAAGALLNEQSLVESTGFGRASIHHALHRLAFENLVEVRPRKGVQVRVWGSKDVSDLVEARIPVECAIARLSCARASDSEIDEMTGRIAETPGLIDRMDREGLLRLDLWFHAAIARSTRNDVLIDTAQKLHQRSAHFWSPVLSGRERYQAVYEQHRDIAAAIAARDADSAGRAVEFHISNFTENRQ